MIINKKHKLILIVGSCYIQIGWTLYAKHDIIRFSGKGKKSGLYYSIINKEIIRISGKGKN